VVVRPAIELLLGLTLATSAVGAAPADDKFAQSYGLDVGEYHGRCLFFLTDIGMNADEVTATLVQNGYDTSRGLEVLVTKTTPKKCAELGLRAAQNAGFKAVRIRLATDKDSWVRP
jgi:hypothetical protein